MLGKIKKFFATNYLLVIILFFASFLRLYRINDLLGFWYDQGRDALIIWDFLNNGKAFLIGPTTGIAGVFRGPWYYWLITPFYLLGNGNPVYPLVFLISTTIVAIGLIYYLGCKIQGKSAGILAAIIASFSFYIVDASKWLSNPTPMLFISLVIVWAMLKVMDGKKWGWPIISFCFGLSLFNFGSSGELFYLPAILIFTIWTVLRQGFGGRSSLNWKIVFVSLASFIITFAPLVIFDFKHQGILRTNIYQSFISEKSFKIPTKSFLIKRTIFYYDVFTKKIFDSRGLKEKIILVSIACWFLISLPKYIKNKGIALLVLMLTSPIIGLYFYQGNKGVLYDYYFTGYYLIFILLFAIVLGDIWRFTIGKIFILYFIYLFLNANLSIILPRLIDKSTGPESIVLSNQKKAIDWIYNDSDNRNFNVDVYVPPVIPYAYDYLLKWLGTTKYHKLPDDSQEKLLYTLYEVDSGSPERLQAWLNRQKGIGKVLKEQRYGGITVQERHRILIK